jgi:hypothetical protein
MRYKLVFGSFSSTANRDSCRLSRLFARNNFKNFITTHYYLIPKSTCVGAFAFTSFRSRDLMSCDSTSLD